ncbi:MAG: hypothetical protein K5990_02055 [Oscillospiraceae bacterium]|nr:hypothetical protein [Oscillospiraceae bacterium]
MAKMKKIIRAGLLVKEAIYPLGTRYDSPKVRQGKRKVSSEAQKRMNAIYSWQKLELMLAANFVPGDLVCVLTYDDAHLPDSHKEAVARLKRFRSLLSAARRKRGQSLVMAWNTEHRHHAPDELSDGRWHHHCVITATGEDYDELLRLWGQGQIYVRPLQVDREKNYESLARYMCKEARDKPGLRSWSYTRNCRKPEVESVRVSDDTSIQPPRGSMVLEDTSTRTEYGYYRFLKYLYRVPSRKRVRRRRRKN